MKTTNGLKFKFVGGGDIDGYGARFGERDLGGDIIDRGAFTKTIAEIAASGHRLPMLSAHEQQDVIGSWRHLREDEAGLYVSGTINGEVARGREVLSLVRSGDLSGLSIGYDVPPGGRVAKAGASHLIEVTLFEISIVAVPMAPKARIVLKELAGVEGYADFLRSAGVSRREAEFIARKSWPAITAADQPEIDFRKVLAQLEAHATDRKSWR